LEQLGGPGVAVLSDLTQLLPLPQVIRKIPVALFIGYCWRRLQEIFERSFTPSEKEL